MNYRLKNEKMSIGKNPTCPKFVVWKESKDEISEKKTNAAKNAPDANLLKQKSKPNEEQLPKRKSPHSQDQTKVSSETEAVQSLYQSFENKLPKERALKNKIEEDSYKFNTNKFFKMYQDSAKEPKKVTKHTVLGDGKIQNIYDNNIQEVIFPNGAKRETFPNGYSIVHFANSDIKQILPDGSVVYYYKEHDTTQISNSKDHVDVSWSDLPVFELSGRVSFRERQQRDQVGSLGSWIAPKSTFMPTMRSSLSFLMGPFRWSIEKESNWSSMWMLHETLFFRMEWKFALRRMGK